LFLPVSLAVFILILRSSAPRLALPWLGIASVVFYIWDDVRLLPLFLGSVTANFLVGTLIFRTGNRTWIWIGILFNVGLIAIFKYADFAISTINDLSALDIGLLGIALPLGISFFTFTQIAWLVDMHAKPKQPRFWNYLLFVSFFPHLIAGPILHHAEMMPQFDRIVSAGRGIYFSRFWTNLAVGVTIFIVGLFKKVMIADSCALIATAVFKDAQAGQNIDALTAWAGVLAYTMQIYFDFSGYSDMAVGLAKMFGIRLPMNFFSPYKSTNIVEFWRRWHMTLSRFLRDYIYFPLGGNRHGASRRYVNLMTTMLIGGLWHGASWTFVLWGGVHGAFLVANHAWNRLTNNRSLGLFGWLLTFLAVANAWVLFRAADMTTALHLYKAMYSVSALSIRAYLRSLYHMMLGY
jgi:D-alanyl-lipoteichoic acid acyltransferase DltB (MBOAT superfamily)